MIKIIFFINFIIANINIFFKYFYIKQKNLFIKNIDKMTINFLKNSYKNISNFLNSKYIVKNNNIKGKKKNNRKKKISLYFSDYYHASPYMRAQYNILKNLLKRKYDLEIKSDNPDYLIFNVFGCHHLNETFQKSIKIAFFTENQVPDLNVADYAIGHPRIICLDRYFKRPYFLGLSFSFNNRYLQLIRRKVLKSHKRKKFCAAVISNFYFTDYFRLKFIDELNNYKHVDMGGRYKNNVGDIKDKIKFLSSYKFSIAMENTEGNGYLSEKIFHSFISGTIPIYYGDYMADEFINPKSFILIRNKKDIFSKIEYIKKIDNSDKLYEKILRENVFIDNYYKKKIENERIEFFYHIFEQDIQKAKRIDNYHWK